MGHATLHWNAHLVISSERMDHGAVFCSWDNKRTDEVAARSERELSSLPSLLSSSSSLVLLLCQHAVQACAWRSVGAVGPAPGLQATCWTTAIKQSTCNMKEFLCFTRGSGTSERCCLNSLGFLRGVSSVKAGAGACRSLSFFSSLSLSLS